MFKTPRDLTCYIAMFAVGFCSILLIGNLLYRHKYVHKSIIINKYFPNKVDTIVYSARKQVEYELSLNKIAYRGENVGEPTRSLIISTWRSGTTFLGDILNAVPASYYHYEPLLSFGFVQIRNGSKVVEALRMARKMLLCDFTGMENYFTYVREHVLQFHHNVRLWSNCDDEFLCCDPEVTSRVCLLMQHQIMKIVRLRLRLLKYFLRDKRLNVKVLYVVRDPRGVMSSRLHYEFCEDPTPDCTSHERLCADQVADFYSLQFFRTLFPGRVMAIRFEDLAFDPYQQTVKICDFFGLNMTESVKEFLNTHTIVYSPYPNAASSTFKISSEVPFKWRNNLNFSYVSEIQDSCQEAMKLWGYRSIRSVDHMTSKDFHPLT